MVIPNRLARSYIGQTRVFVVKLASRCNLACSYCYMYEHVDQSWRHQPKFMSVETIRALGLRLEEQAKSMRDGCLMVVAHGGEPLLHPDLDYFFTELKRAVRSCKLVFAIQTNGTLLTSENLAILERHAVRVGISIDGNRESHNRMRITRDGKGTYDKVIQGLRLAKTTIPQLFDSILQVIDPSVPPVEMLDLLETYGVRRADLLFPDFNHDSFKLSGLKTGDIGRWLVSVFEEWAQRSETVYLRLFVTIIHLLQGGRYGTDQLGSRAVGTLIVETDGSYQIYDGLKTAFHGAGFTGLDVGGSAIREVETLPLARAFREKASAAATACLECQLFSICGGGSPIHRYSTDKGFDLPSVYCDDLTMLIEHIRAYLGRVRPHLSLAV